MKKITTIKLLSLALCILCTLSTLVGCADVCTATDKATESPSIPEQTVASQTTEAEVTVPSETLYQDITTTQESTTVPSTSKAPESTKNEESTETPKQETTLDSINIPDYSGNAYIPLLNNQPTFRPDEYTTQSYENYGALDSLGRCTQVYACIGRDLMPTDERGSIGSVKPSGWQTVKYDIVDGKYLYNRCHLIGWQLTGENANTKNLITGTRYLNIEGMLPFENMVADYIKETNNHVLYRVTPIFDGNDLVAKGIIMEAWSVEDNGDGICFCIFAYNVQPGIEINYANGDSKLTEQQPTETTPAEIKPAETTAPETTPPETQASQNANVRTYILNKSTKKFHFESCGSAKLIADKNKGYYTGTRDELINDGYKPCGNCDP